MPARLLALLLAFVLLWSGLPGHTPAMAAASADGAAAAVAQAADAAPAAQAANAAPLAPLDEPLVDDRHAPAYAETVADVPGMPVAGAAAPAPGMAMARPRVGASPAPRGPFLAGPQRPPSTLPRVA